MLHCVQANQTQVTIYSLKKIYMTMVADNNVCPSFAFETDDTSGLCVQATPLGRTMHAVCVSLLHLWKQINFAQIFWV